MDNIFKSFEDLNNIFKSDNQLIAESFEKALRGSETSEEFHKSWSTDLKEKFPNGDWKTVNGAKVFVNNGKVVAGLEGFNGEIDKFFKEKEKKSSQTYNEMDDGEDKLRKKLISYVNDGWIDGESLQHRFHHFEISYGNLTEREVEDSFKLAEKILKLNNDGDKKLAAFEAESISMYKKEGIFTEKGVTDAAKKLGEFISQYDNKKKEKIYGGFTSREHSLKQSIDGQKRNLELGVITQDLYDKYVKTLTEYANMSTDKPKVAPKTEEVDTDRLASKIKENVLENGKQGSRIRFTKPIPTKDGGFIVGYDWSFKVEDVFNKHKGEYQAKRVSDWNASMTSADTNRELVHKIVKVDSKGENPKIVSLESAFGEISSDGSSKLKSVKSAAKTIMKHESEIAKLENFKNEVSTIRGEVSKQVSESDIENGTIKRGSSGEPMGVVVSKDFKVKGYTKNSNDYFVYFDKDKNEMVKDLTDQITHHFISSKYPKVISTDLKTIDRGISSIKNSIEKIEKKLKQL